MSETGGQTVGLKMAKASPEDLRIVRDFFQMLEEVIEYGTFTAGEDAESERVDDERLSEMIRDRGNDRGPGVGSAWRRVVYGADILIKNCCDPELDHLEWRKDVRELFEEQQRQQLRSE
jgi:hypothetical protein